MKMMLLVLMASVSFASSVQAGSHLVKYNIFRNNVLRTFKESRSQADIYKRFKGKSSLRGSAESCEVHLKSTKDSTILNIFFPTSDGQPVQEEFSNYSEISEEGGTNKFKYSSHYIGCSGDQYEAGDCWKYGHFEMLLEKGSKGLLVSLKGQNCIVKL